MVHKHAVIIDPHIITIRAQRLPACQLIAIAVAGIIRRTAFAVRVHVVFQDIILHVGYGIHHIIEGVVTANK